ncbi:hypothetical protein LINPERPRIM_LOCUS30578 [Linum perenne]
MIEGTSIMLLAITLVTAQSQEWSLELLSRA